MVPLSIAVPWLEYGLFFVRESESGIDILVPTATALVNSIDCVKWLTVSLLHAWPMATRKTIN